MSVTAVVLDIGGVLELNPRTGWQARWAARLGLAPDELQRELDRLWSPGETGALSLAEIERRTADDLGLNAVALGELMDDAWAEYVGSLNQELADYFRGLRSRCRTGLLSNSFVGAREREQETYGFEDMCDTIVYSHEVGCKKPDPRIYRVVCKRLAVAPGEVLFVDDVQSNVDGARAIGMRAIPFVDNQDAIARIEAQLGG